MAIHRPKRSVAGDQVQLATNVRFFEHRTAVPVKNNLLPLLIARLTAQLSGITRKCPLCHMPNSSNMVE
jgi:hypothetical protein